MLNFIRFDIKKLLRMKATWISLTLLSLLLVFVTCMTYYEVNQPYEDYVERVESFQKSSNERASREGIKVEVQSNSNGGLMSEEEFEQSKKEELETLTLSNALKEHFGATCIFIYILMAIFIGNDFSSGYLKNMLAIKGAKWKWLTAKLASATFIFILMKLVIFIISYGGHAYMGRLDQPFSLMDHLVLIIPQWLLYLVIMFFITTISLIFQSKVSIIVVATLMGAGIHKQLIKLISDSLNIDFTQHLYSVRFFQMGDQFVEHVLPVIGIGVLYLIGLYILNRWLIYRIDFKFDH